jgi:DNA-directed RNA polymerase alpha subunit
MRSYSRIQIFSWPKKLRQIFFRPKYGEYTMTPIDTTNFTTRTRNCLWAENLVYREQVSSMTDQELLRVPNLGRHSLAEIRTEIPHITSIGYMREVLRDIQKQVVLLEALLDKHTEMV